MLTVQEKTGPAAAFGLRKIPTGLSPKSDIHQAAVLLELQEETGLMADFDGVSDRPTRQVDSGPCRICFLFVACGCKNRMLLLWKRA
jgi:hypothetical protein